MPDTPTDLIGVGAIGKALKRLVDVCANGVGALWEPVQIVRLAHAEVERRRILAAGERDLAKLLAAETGTQPPSPPEPLEGEVVDSDEAAPLPLVRRADRRTRHQEAKRQLNLEAVAAEAAKLLGDVADSDVTDAPVDDDWVARFFGYVQDVSHAEMRGVWARLLAGEIVQPGTHSPRTLDVLRNLTRREAQLFERITPYVAVDVIHKLGGLAVERSHPTVPFGVVLELMDAGLVNPETTLTRSYSGAREEFHLVFTTHVLRVTHPPEVTPPDLEILRLTPAGTELARVLATPVDVQHVRTVARTFVRAGCKAFLCERSGVNTIQVPGEEVLASVE